MLKAFFPGQAKRYVSHLKTHPYVNHIRDKAHFTVDKFIISTIYPFSYYYLMCIPWIMTSKVSLFFFSFYLTRIHWKMYEKFDKFDFFSSFVPCYHQIYMYNIFISFVNFCRVPYMGKGTFSIIVNQTESKAKTPSTDSQFLIPGFPASKLRAEKMVLSSYGLKLSNGKGKNTHTVDISEALGFQTKKLLCRMRIRTHFYFVSFSSFYYFFEDIRWEVDFLFLFV